jgi:D-alanyl-D-alanine carboxypeptidase
MHKEVLPRQSSSFRATLPLSAFRRALARFCFNRIMELTRMPASRALRLTAFAVAMLLGGPVLAAAPALVTPAVVVDVKTGRVLHAERATDPWFPASITKLMTTYVALSLVRDGRAAMDQLLTVPEEAAALPPSKMGFKPGTQIRLDNALKMIMVKSANDIAATIAVGLGGSVDDFAALMNETALRLGMRESRFVNPHGLPDDRQQTSARDMAILGRALLTQFPEHQDLFQIGAIQYGRRIMRNHNGLIGRYAGADGMKTGFICASGFNVVASASRDGRRLLTVVLGSPSANERTLRAASLLDRGFATFGLLNPQLDQLPRSTMTAATNMRSVICDRRGPLPGEEDGAPVTASAGESPETASPQNPLFNSTSLLAFTGSGDAALKRTTLGPRAPVQPVRVWVGLNPPDPASEEEEPAAKGKGRKDLKVKPLARSAAAEAADDDKASQDKADKTATKPAKRARMVVKPVAASAAEKGAESGKAEASPKPAAKKKPVATNASSATKPGEASRTN